MHELLDRIKLDKKNELWIIKKQDPQYNDIGYSVEGRERHTFLYFFKIWLPCYLGAIEETEYGFAYNLFSTFQEAIVFANDFKLKYPIS